MKFQEVRVVYIRLSVFAICCLAFPIVHATAAEPAAGTEIVHPVDGSIMVYVPAGEFIMGMDTPESDKLAKALEYKDYREIAAEEWAPQRRESIPGYFIDQCEVTNEQWRKFVASSGFKSKLAVAKEPPSAKPTDYAVYPVVSVAWGEAQKYANWAKKQLPTEKQWEKAARGTDGRAFPWGNELPTAEHGVFVNLADDKSTSYQPIGSKPRGASPVGCLDMAGNVYEWTSEWHEPYPNCPEAERLAAYMGHENGCLRGGSFYHARHAYACAKRFGFRPEETYYHVGFRTVWQPPSGYFESAEYRAARAAVVGRRAAMVALRQQAASSPVNAF